MASRIDDDMYDYLKQFFEKVSDDPGGKYLIFFRKPQQTFQQQT